jgi:hypothetical protein
MVQELSILLRKLLYTIYPTLSIKLMKSKYQQSLHLDSDTKVTCTQELEQERAVPACTYLYTHRKLTNSGGQG